MVKRLLFISLLAASVMAACTGNGGDRSTLDTSQFNYHEDNGGITLPDGFKAVVVADSLGYGRHLAVNDNGDIYLALRELTDGSGIVALRDTTGNGVADRVEFFGDEPGTGITLFDGYLYFGTETSVLRYNLEGADLVPEGDPEVVVDGFLEQNQHATKAITIDKTGTLYVNIGGPSNACQEETRTRRSPGQDPCPQLEWQGGVWKFDANSTGQTLKEDGERYATGIRNAVALEWNDKENQLYAVQHGRDQLNQLWPDLYTAEENAAQPGEEFFEVDEGDHFGWPYAYYDWKKEQKLLAPEYGGDGTIPASEHGDYEDPIYAFPGHWGPNDLIFYTGNQFPKAYRDGAFVAFHGSWNRAPLPQEGYNVVYLPFKNGDPSGDHQVFADGFAGKDTLMTPSNARYRPTGLAQGPEGTLFISDSREGRVWRVIFTGK